MNESPLQPPPSCTPAWKVLGTARGEVESQARSAELTGPAGAQLSGFEPQP